MTHNDTRTIIAAGSSVFCGSGKNMTRVLDQLGRRGHEVHYVTNSTPHLLGQIKTAHFKTHTVAPPVSHFVTGKGALEVFALSERLAELALEKLRQNSKPPILWATYLFPYVLAALVAKRIVRLHSGISLRLVASPAGSDIWQIGHQQPNNVSFLLHDPDIDSRVTYSRKFAREIEEHFGKRAVITVIPPVVDCDQFRPLSEEERCRKRARFGIDEKTVVVVALSNQRPIKRPEFVAVAVEDALRQSLSQPEVLLLIVGPRPETSDAAHWMARLRRMAPESSPTGLPVLWTGVTHHVSQFLQIADLGLNLSLHDSFNISILEGLACGVPCVTTSAAAVADIVRSADCGIVVPSTVESSDYDAIAALLAHPRSTPDVDEVARSITVLLDDPQRRQQMADRAANTVRQRFAPTVVVPEYERMLLNVELVNASA